MMKKYLFVAGMVAAPLTAAIAKSIDFDTPVKWNGDVVEQALNQAGFLGASDAYHDVRVTHQRILSELLKKNTFSLRDATQVCLDKCSLSDFLKNGRGASGKKCPDLCKGFSDALVSVNNTFTKTGILPIGHSGLVTKLPDGTYKIYSEDKEYYALVKHEGKPALYDQYPNVCNPECISGFDPTGVLFESKSQKPVGYLSQRATDDHMQSCCFAKEYERENWHVWAYIENGTTLRYRADEQGEVYLDVTDQDYENKYNTLSRRYNELKDAIRTMDSIDKNDFKTYTTSDIKNNFDNAYSQAQQWVSAFASKAFTKTSFYRYDELVGFDKTHRNYPAYSDIIEANICIRNLKGLNGTTVNWAEGRDKTQTKTAQEAYKLATNDIRGRVSCRPLLDWSKLKCQDNGCGTWLGQDDTVTCTIGDVTMTYIFDDICNKKLGIFGL